jgi:hypothetical protein
MTPFEAILAECRDNEHLASSDALTSHFIRERCRVTISECLATVSRRTVAEPIRLYDVIVIDPPWPMQKIEHDVRPNQSRFDYPTMSEDELNALTLPENTNCHVWLWTTDKFMQMAKRLLEHWSLRYIGIFSMA